MKKRILSAVLVSGVTLGAATAVNADDLNAKINTQDAIISNLTAEQQAAQSKVNSLQNQIGSLQTQQDSLSKENEELAAKSSELEKEIQLLSAKIIARSEVLNNQARSTQKGNTTANYFNTLLNSKSISDAVNRVFAIREVVTANAKILEQQKEDKAALEQKQTENQEAINKVAANMETLASNKVSLETQQAELEVAKLDLSAQMTSAQEEKDKLLSQKAAAEAAAKAAAEAAQRAQEEAKAKAQAQAESVAKAQAEIQQMQPAPSSVAPEATPAPSAIVAPVAAQSAPAPAAAPTATTITPQASYGSASTYPVGQCTWGVKSLAPWVGNYWGNGGQWAYSAAAAGFRVGSTPTVGSVVVWNDGGYGHVAYVTGVQGGQIQVMEANYNGNQSIGNYRGWFTPSGVSYIYPN
ncbi:CHAP domain-containing protein [Streptococcus didelphis]|uniref:CHAP domain-containing protein n=1 Tax=Streptococcus didelphis TaxID=102886 RepID=A0ABY9LFB3_9STRE|nr:CHAP domain-containing protein [Streptococcus didelphis]WMB27620.1 CHAP domain-containing protein [Streptococcus didelphis]WMB29510.1 CHAP domain-containing protein [Streptococcus didelphis]